jgi:hypothetical protein
MTTPLHVFEVRPRRDKRGFDLISDALPFGLLWYVEVSDAIGYAKFSSRSRRHSRLRCGWQRDQNARARGRFQRVVNFP